VIHYIAISSALSPELLKRWIGSQQGQYFTSTGQQAIEKCGTKFPKCVVQAVYLHNYQSSNNNTTLLFRYRDEVQKYRRHP